MRPWESKCLISSKSRSAQRNWVGHMGEEDFWFHSKWSDASWHPQSWLTEGCTVGLTCGGTMEACLVLVLVDLRWAEALWRQIMWHRSDIRVLQWIWLVRTHVNSNSTPLTAANCSHVTSSRSHQASAQRCWASANQANAGTTGGQTDPQNDGTTEGLTLADVLLHALLHAAFENTKGSASSEENYQCDAMGHSKLLLVGNGQRMHGHKLTIPTWTLFDLWNWIVIC